MILELNLAEIRPRIWKITLFLMVFGIALWLYFNNIFTKYEQQVDREVAAFVQHAETIPNKLYSHHDIANLPAPVQRYAEYACILGSENIKFAHLKHTGFFRTKPNDSFVPINGEAFYITDSPGFIWKGNMKMNGLPVAIKDRYWNGEGSR